ncbi:hypothetical protein [Nostoc sp. FACHB-110]|uniref:hypothetical protein n=1 Tax=Nostoc sp. FACHB-110 TaxID=2692834 RepID=UPI00168927D6|nr:hypothetical protein [Nostoc sp. FACHB-110]MBD2437218.1 hypothetical protein [Nostoc sp. FACHB-110]
MNLWYVNTLKQLLSRSFSIYRWLFILVLAIGLSSCGDRAASQDVSVVSTERPPQMSQQFNEVAPPDVIQELRQTLEIYRPQVTIISPQPNEFLQDTTVTVRLQVKDLPIFKDPQFELGPHLHVILDNQPYIPVYDLNQPLILPDLAPGTHTLRVFASRPWYESFKNEGAYAQTTFHIFTKTDDNNPDPSLPLLTYSYPQGSYGAEPILLDFYLTNAPLRLGAKDNSDDRFSDWRIRCTINGESFVFDRWQAVYLKGFKPGNNWVKLEFLDNQGNALKNAFNTTVRLVNYQPKSKDTLSRIIRGELKTDEVRSIVDQNYTAKPPLPEPTPALEEQPIPTPEIPEVVAPQPEVTPTQQATESPSPQPEVTPTPEPQPTVTPTQQATESPSPQPEVTLTPEPQPTVTPTQQATKSPSPQPEVTPTPEPQPEVTPTAQPQSEVTATPQQTEVLGKQETESLKSRLGKYFQRRPRPTSLPSLVPGLPEVIESPVSEPTLEE